MSGKEVEQHINALDLRERVIDHAGDLRRHAAGRDSRAATQACKRRLPKVVIEQRLYRGDIDTPKTTTSKRTVAIPPKTADRRTGMDDLVVDGKSGCVGFRFRKSARGPMWRDNIWYRYMKPKLEERRARLGQFPGDAPDACQLSGMTPESIPRSRPISGAMASAWRSMCIPRPASPSGPRRQKSWKKRFLPLNGVKWSEGSCWIS